MNFSVNCMIGDNLCTAQAHMPESCGIGISTGERRVLFDDSPSVLNHSLVMHVPGVYVTLLGLAPHLHESAAPN